MLFTTLSQIILASELTLLCAAAKKILNAIINNFFISAIVPNGQQCMWRKLMGAAFASQKVC
jgi:hypothetical protein